MLATKDLESFDYEIYKQLKKEMEPADGEAKKLSDYIDKLKPKYSLGSEVIIKNTCYTGVIKGYNDKVCGFYPGLRYPLLVEITGSSKQRFESSVGSIFEYCENQIELR